VCVAQVPGADASTDFIAAYAPADVDLHATAPVKVRREGEREEDRGAGIEGEDGKEERREGGGRDRWTEGGTVMRMESAAQGLLWTLPSHALIIDSTLFFVISS